MGQVNFFTGPGDALIGQKVIHFTRRYTYTCINFTFAHTRNHHLVANLFTEFWPGDAIFLNRLAHLLWCHFLVSGHTHHGLIQIIIIHIYTSLFSRLHQSAFGDHLIQHLLAQNFLRRKLHFLAMQLRGCRTYP